MRRDRTAISDKWIRASIIGTIWAAAEIVLGSFLHNLRVPFSGNMLTAIALVILIAVSYRWRQHGLYWRAGLICAMMKAMSPSAIIFGPMIAIIMESVLLEISVRLLGRTYLGFIIGSMLAMSWNLFQKVFNMVIFYGGNLVEIYSSLTAWASKQLNLRFDAFWAPLLLLLSLYSLFGAMTAVVGIVTGRRIASLPPEEALPEAPVIRTQKKRRNEPFGYSLAWLAADITLVAGALVVVSLLSWIWWIIAVIPVVVILAIRYQRAMRQLSKPGFWVTFVVITMLSALAFAALKPGENTLAEAILIGVQMNFRAVIIIVGFSALGTELYNPKIRSLFSRTRLRQLPLALELSAASLPTMIADMPDLKTAMKMPVSILNRMITRVEKRLQEARNEQEERNEQKARNEQEARNEQKVRNEREDTRKVYIVTGDIGAGKTAWLVKLTGLLMEKGVKVAGILALRIMEEGRATGYDVSDIMIGIRTPFLRQSGAATMGVERFTVDEAGYKAGLKALDPASNNHSEVIIIDEVGPLELRGQGWDGRITELLADSGGTVILAVRRNLVGEVTERYGLSTAELLDVDASDVMKCAWEIAALTAKQKKNERYS